MEPVRLFVVDIDGCLVAIEHAPYDLELLGRLAALNAQSRDDPAVPPLTILSGRPHPYVDALMQVLDIRVPAIFENGAGLAIRSPYGARYRSEVEDGRSDLDALLAELRDRQDFTIQPGKSASLTLFPKDPQAGIAPIEEFLADVLQRRGLSLIVDPAHECVNVLVPGVDKGLGLRWLAQEVGVPLAQIAGIGDSPGDLAWLSRCGVSCAPANAPAPVRGAVDRVSEHEDIRATLELYASLIESNRALQMGAANQ